MPRINTNNKEKIIIPNVIQLRILLNSPIKVSATLSTNFTSQGSEFQYSGLVFVDWLSRIYRCIGRNYPGYQRWVSCVVFNILIHIEPPVFVIVLHYLRYRNNTLSKKHKIKLFFDERNVFSTRYTSCCSYYFLRSNKYFIQMNLAFRTAQTH